MPADLFDEFDSPAADISQCIGIVATPTRKGRMQKVVAKRDFNPRLFSKRELALMHELVKQYGDSTAEQMIEATHLENRPWHQVYNVEKRHQAPIPYDLALNKQEKELMERQVTERQEVVENYKNVKDDGPRNDSV